MRKGIHLDVIRNKRMEVIATGTQPSHLSPQGKEGFPFPSTITISFKSVKITSSLQRVESFSGLLCDTRTFSFLGAPTLASICKMGVPFPSLPPFCVGSSRLMTSNPQTPFRLSHGEGANYSKWKNIILMQRLQVITLHHSSVDCATPA